MAFEHAGRKFTNADAMRSHKAMSSAPAPVAEGGGEEEEHDPSDAPVMTEHHPDGTHTTHHASGKQVHHGSHEELAQHLAKHVPEQEPDGDEDEPGPWEQK